MSPPIRDVREVFDAQLLSRFEWLRGPAAAQ
jgi:hypothetical protein